MKKQSVYAWLCILGGFLGLHKFYLEEYDKGLLYMVTIGLFMFGWFRDMMHMRGDVDRYNTKRGYVNTTSRS